MFKETFHHSWYPFQNQAEIDRVRKITFEDIVAMNGKHPTNPNIQLDVLPVDQFETVMITDMLKRIIESDRNDTPCIMIMCNPNPTYIKVAYMLQQLKVNMRNVKFYINRYALGILIDLQSAVNAVIIYGRGKEHLTGLGDLFAMGMDINSIDLAIGQLSDRNVIKLSFSL